MLGEPARREIARLWNRKLHQDTLDLPLPERHRNLEPASAEFLGALAAGLGAQRMLEIGGSSGLSTLALAAAARQTSGRVTSIEKDPQRQAEAQQTLARFDLARYVEFVLADAAVVLPSLGEFDLVFIDCEKEDYIRFSDMLRVPAEGTVVADNIISHALTGHIAHVRSRPGVAAAPRPFQVQEDCGYVRSLPGVSTKTPSVGSSKKRSWTAGWRAKVQSVDGMHRDERAQLSGSKFCRCSGCRHARDASFRFSPSGPACRNGVGGDGSCLVAM